MMKILGSLNICGVGAIVSLVALDVKRPVSAPASVGTLLLLLQP